MQTVIKNVIAIDQEEGKFVMTINGDDVKLPFDPNSLPLGGGIVAGDGNCWKTNNGKSKSQFMSSSELDELTATLHLNGYRAIVVANMLAHKIQLSYRLTQADAVIGLGKYAMAQVAMHGSFDSGHEVRPNPYPDNDNSFGERQIVTDDFLRVQNDGGYNSPWMADVIEIAFHTFDDADRRLFGFTAKSKPSISNPFKLAAIAVAVYDPWTGKLRMHEGKPWGLGFITRRIIGLNGLGRGTGPNAPGNPMRAALRAIGGRCWLPSDLGELKPKGNPVRKQDCINRAERAHFDRLIRDLIRAFQMHGDIRPVMMEA